jgi:hypothetical protein
MAVDLGPIGIWQRATSLDSSTAAEIEKLGYGTIWIGGSPPGDLRLAEELLDATSTIAVASTRTRRTIRGPKVGSNTLHNRTADPDG